MGALNPLLCQHHTKVTELGQPPSFATKMALGSACGAAASVLGVPADVVMVRMAADAKVTSAAHLRRYRAVCEVLS